MSLNFIRGLIAAILILAAGQITAYGNNPKSGEGPTKSGTVLETMQSGGYTYMKLKQDNREFWAAAPKTQVAVGDSVRFKEQMRIKNFTSKTLNRSFDELVFISRVGGTSAAAETSRKKQSPSKKLSSMDPITKAEGGYTVAELFAKKDELKGKVIKVRGKVVKVSQAIMGMNWVHLKDGSGSAGTDKVIFRSPDKLATVGSVVVAEGAVVTDQDFGYGYKYDLLIDNSTFTE